MPPADAIARIAPTPVLVVHGDHDDFFPVDHAEQIYAAAESEQASTDGGSPDSSSDDEEEIVDAEVVETPEVAATPEPKQAHTSTELLEQITGTAVDSPLCMTCGTKMRPAGSCYVCEGCGSTSGCS